MKKKKEEGMMIEREMTKMEIGEEKVVSRNMVMVEDEGTNEEMMFEEVVIMVRKL